MAKWFDQSSFTCQQFPKLWEAFSHNLHTAWPWNQCYILLLHRDAAQNDVGNSMPLKQEHTVYGALAGLLLSTDAKDVQQLVEKCRRHGLFIWVPSGCWLEGSKQAVIAAP